MKILFDEDVPRPLRRHLPGHEISTVQEMGWAGVKNGELLMLFAQHRFDVLLTFDQNLRHKQNLTGRPFALVVIIAKSKRMDKLIPLVHALQEELARFEPGEADEVRSEIEAHD